MPTPPDLFERQASYWAQFRDLDRQARLDRQRQGDASDRAHRFDLSEIRQTHQLYRSQRLGQRAQVRRSTSVDRNAQSQSRT